MQKLKNDKYNRQVILNKDGTFSIVGLKDTKELKVKYNRFVSQKSFLFFDYFRNSLYNLYSKYYFSKPNLINRIINILLPLPFDIDKNIKSILDIGCSSGDFLEKLPYEYRKTGIDINKLAVQNAISKNIEAFEVDFNNFESKQKYDFIRIFHVIEHIEDYHKFFKQLSKYSNGYVAIATPNSNSLSHKIFGNYWSGFFDKTHFTIFDLKSLEMLANKYGFKLTRWSTYPMGMSVDSLLRFINIKDSSLIHKILFFGLALILLPVEILISILGMGGALYVELKKEN
jgi:2-polyprenyl-3-methyl-5-hydroxy-6-metoxy-1,4-benzoquinol methylase